ncbi:MAG: sensor histidine kinase [Sphingobium sp.]
MFFILAIALLPLAVIALVATLKSINTAEVQKQQLLTAAVEQSAGKLQAQITAIKTAQSLTVNSIAHNITIGDICGRMQIFVRGGEDAKDVHFIVVERSGKIICPATDASQLRTADALALRGKSDAQIFPTVGGILIRSASDDGRVIAATLYGASYLDRLNGVRKADGRRAVWYEQNGDTIRVGDTIRYTARKNISRASAAVGETGIRMTIAVDDPPASLARSLSLLLPLLMSVAAAFLGWLVVRWLLINPLVALQRVVATYQPGTVIEPPRDIRSASGEIAELGKAFQDMSQHVADHEEEMGAALQRQMKLTREVHHRVKNNVQIMSSLISLRARATDQADARAAYASIQRRVDALAVVQRNHYAELEENFGVSACPLISEIAASLRASVPESRPPIAILVDCDPVNMDQDVAAPVAFLIAELADIAIASHSASQLRIALIAEPEPARQARLSITSDAFDDENTAPSNATHLYQRILTGLSRQLRQPLTYDAEAHEYSIMLQILRDPSETFA